MRAEPIAGRYELVEQIQAGGMGRVWRGYDGVLDREVAVKLIRPDVISTPEQANEFAKRFRREARVTARIAHHGVPQVYDAVLDLPYDRVYLVMELVHGTPLRAFIDPAEPLPVAWVAAIGAQIATVLSHAHAVPAVHRDLKPENVLVTGNGAVKVIDFGIAAILRTDITRLTATGSPVGTTRYMSPEQIQGGQITPHSDLYALGCVLHELLTGRHLVTGDSEFAMMQQHVSGTPTPVRALRPDVPEAMEQLILDLLAKAPELVRPEPATTPPPPDDSRLDDTIQAAVSRSDTLLADERFSQAAEALQQAITPAAGLLGPEHNRVLRLRARRAAILVLGGDFRRALPEFDALAAAYARTAGPASEPALDCLRQAAHCRAELGHTATALHQFQQVLAHVREAHGDASPTALDLRRSIGILLLAEGRATEAERVLQPLHQDLGLVYGPDHEETREIAGILARLQIARPPQPPEALRDSS